MGTLQAGSVSANITPPVGIEMAGFAGRDHGSVGIHDELWTRVVYMTDGDMEIAFVANDLIGMNAKAVAEIRKLVTEQSGVPEENVFICCSHTHSGPVTHFNNHPADIDDIHSSLILYMGTLFRKIAGAVFEAKRNACPAKIGWGRTDVQVGVNRREKTPDGRIILGVNPDGTVAPFVDVIVIDNQDTNCPIAIMFSHAAHPVVMGPDNYLTSADYPGVAQSFVASNTGAVSMFMNGCCGNINAHPRGTFDIVQLLGKRLGSAVVKAYTEINEFHDEVSLSCTQHFFSLPVEDIPSIDECEKQVEDAKKALESAENLENYESKRWAVPSAKRELQRAEARLELAKSGDEDVALPVEVQAIGIDKSLAFVSLPGEIFVEIGLEIADKSDFSKTIVVSNANGSIGYVPIEEEIPKGGYEVTSAIARHKGLTIKPDADKVLIAGALIALNRLI